MKIEFHRRGHLRTGNLVCNKCGVELRNGEYNECWFCGPVCTECGYECFEQNKHIGDKR